MLLPLIVTLLALQPASLNSAKPARVVLLQGRTAHVQGIDTDGVHLWVTAVDRASRRGWLQEFAVADGHLERSIELQDGDRYHPGGIATDTNSIWLPVAEYRATSTAIIQQRNKKTLALEFQFSVPDHVGCVAVTPEYIIGGNWDSRDFYVWDRKGNLIRKVASETGNSYQDLKFDAGSVVGSGTLTGRQGAVDWLDLRTFRLNSRLLIGNTDTGAPLTREGMTIFKGDVWFLPEDGDSRLFIYSLPKRP